MLPNGRGGRRHVGVDRTPVSTIYNDIHQCARCGIDVMLNSSRDHKGLCGDCRSILHPVKREKVTVCQRNHEFTPENTRWNAHGYRTCRECERMRNRRAKAAQRARRAA